MRCWVPELAYQASSNAIRDGVVVENLGWFDVEAGAMLRRGLPFPFHYENSAKLSALAEMWFSEQAGKPLRDFIYVTVRGGVGTGVVTGGQILQGSFSAASEFGHIPVVSDGRPCACGSRGCWDQYAADYALCRLYAELGGESQSGDGGSSEVVRRAREGQPVARQAVEETARYAAMGFANLIWAFNPEAMVVDNWLAESWDMVESIVWETIRRRVPAYYLNGVRIYPAPHAADSSLMGAVALVLNRYFTSFDHEVGVGRDHSVVMNRES